MFFVFIIGMYPQMLAIFDTSFSLLASLTFSLPLLMTSWKLWVHPYILPYILPGEC